MEAFGIFEVDLWDARAFSEVLNEELIVVHKRIVVEGDWIVPCPGDTLIVAADIGDDVGELGEFVGLVLIELIWGWPGFSDNHTVGPIEGLPDGLGNEWRERMEHLEDLLEGALEEIGVFPEFFSFDEPVGVLVPDEIVDEVAGFSEAIMLDEMLEFLIGGIDLGANPIFAEISDFDLVGFGRVIIDDILNETGDVPDFVAEIATCHYLAGAESLVDTGGATSDEAEAECVRAVFADDFDWIDDVAFGLAHFLTFFIENHAVHVDIFEWNFVGDIEAEHNHAADPLE